MVLIKSCHELLFDVLVSYHAPIAIDYLNSILKTFQMNKSFISLEL